MAEESQIWQPQGEYCLPERVLDGEYDASPDNIHKRNVCKFVYFRVNPRYPNDYSAYRSKM